ncbi:MAG TPA: HNH endonuclease [Actinomycetota bacterium]|nr:HNH endonuclease [Actinomycetota bacterium]
MAKHRPERPCSFTGCERPSYCKGLCQRHYEQQHEGKPLTPIRPKLKRQPDTCQVPGCTRKPRSKGICGMHAHRIATHGDPGGPDTWRRTACQVPGCVRKHQAHGYCATHLRRWQLYGDHDGAAKPQPCATPDCCNAALGRHTKANGYCGPCHLNRWLDAYLAGEAAAKRYPTGYEYFDLNRQRYAVHRLVMERLLGRPLHPFENVHHRNGRPGDNRPSNLELWVTPQPPGQRPEDLAAWVVEYYPELVRAELERQDPNASSQWLRQNGQT